ncbi:MAG TPA: DNA-binding protein [Anaerolineae bacterium]|nr:DNA-binding protein [Anaerolineae bacterium]
MEMKKKQPELEITPEVIGVLFTGLCELVRSRLTGAQPVSEEAFRRVVHVLATCAFVSPMWRGEPALAAAADLAARSVPPVQEEWVPLSEASRRTGVPVSTLRRWCAQGRLPSFCCRKVGRSWQVEIGEMERLLDEV